MISHQRYCAKRERKRIRRMGVLKGRLIAYGSKSVPFAVKLEMQAARDKREAPRAIQ